jgi:hypothetical protein
MVLIYFKSIHFLGLLPRVTSPFKTPNQALDLFLTNKVHNPEVCTKSCKKEVN